MQAFASADDLPDLSGNWKLYISSDEENFPEYFFLTISKNPHEGPHEYRLNCDIKIDNHGFSTLSARNHNFHRHFIWTWLAPNGEKKTQNVIIKMDSFERINLGNIYDGNFIEIATLEKMPS